MEGGVKYIVFCNACAHVCMYACMHVFNVTSGITGIHAICAKKLNFNTLRLKHFHSY